VCNITERKSSLEKQKNKEITKESARYPDISIKNEHHEKSEKIIGQFIYSCLLHASTYSQYSIYLCSAKITAGQIQAGETQKGIKG
jgi:hypothetical protein